MLLSMSQVREIEASGQEALALTTQLLQRARLAQGEAGLWEAADFQWWWRTPRRSDDIAKIFWLDDEGPVAGIQLTSWTDENWQCDPLVMAGVKDPAAGVVWARALELAARHAVRGFDVPVGNDDHAFLELASQAGLVAGFQDHTAWMAADEWPAVLVVPDGFTLVNRSQRPGQPHPLISRNGPDVEQRLSACSLYDPQLDLAIMNAGGQVAGYSLYWFDPTTRVGLVEPVRVEDEFQRRGLARAMLTAGIDRLFALGAERVKVSYETEAAGALYQGIGFRPSSATTWYRAAAAAASSG